MNSKNRFPTTALQTDPGSPAFFLQRFQGRKKAVSHGPHRHHFFEIVVIEEGTGTHILADGVVPAKRGDIFVISPGESHNPDGLDSTTHWILAFDGSFISRGCGIDRLPYSGLPGEIVLLGFARSPGASPIACELSEMNLQLWLSFFEMAQKEFAEKQLGYVERTHALLTLILIDIARLAAPTMTFSTGKNRAILVKFFAILEGHFRNRLNLNQLAKQLKLSSAYLTDLIRKETGKTAMDWLRSRRLSEGKLLLLETEKSIKEIAVDVGYSDSNLFIRHFRQDFGQSPNAWRESQS